MDLFDRLRDFTATKVASFVIQISRTFEKDGKQAVIDKVNEDIEDLRKAYGYNYWEVAFQKGLVNSDVFWDYYTKGLLV